MREQSAVTHGAADSEAAVCSMTVVVTEDSQHHLSRTRLLYNVIVATDCLVGVIQQNSLPSAKKGILQYDWRQSS